MSDPGGTADRESARTTGIWLGTLFASIAFGGLAQLARAPALQAGGQRFESVILHSKKEYIDILEVELSNERSEVHKHEQIKNKQNQDIRTSDRLSNQQVYSSCRAKGSARAQPGGGDSETGTFHKKNGKEKRAHEGCLGSRRRRRT